MDLDTYALSYVDWSCMGDAFRIEDLSEISNEDIAGPIPIAIMESAAKDSGEIGAPDVQFPPLEEEIGLEWLSDFPGDSKCEEREQSQTESEHCSAQSGAVAQNRMLKMAIPSRARSKRSRVRVWPSEPGDLSRLYEDPEKRAKKKPGNAGGAAQPRRCSHCQSQKTPQWRAGPLGPKSLCNACGVRYKSGRLLPEYRPAKSPTFVCYKHSNSHKKVLELRRSA